MLTYDFSQLLRTAIGFERLISQIESSAHHASASEYPPCNIESDGDDRYRITLAVAGFDQSELDIDVTENTLSVSGRKADDGTNAEYLYQGISHGEFVRRFELADYVRVTGANFNNGLLTIDLLREIPEEKKPRRIDIKAGAPASFFHKARKLIQGPFKKKTA
jgi:molecular chaperone IbpA